MTRDLRWLADMVDVADKSYQQGKRHGRAAALKNECPNCEREAGSPTLSRGRFVFHCAACGHRWSVMVAVPELHAKVQETLRRLRQLLGRSQRLEAVWGRLRLDELEIVVAAAERARVRAHKAGVRSAIRRRLPARHSRGFSVSA